MLLVAAMAVAFGLARPYWPRLGGGGSPGEVREWANATAGAVMLVLTPAFIPLRLLPPRPSIRRVMRQPGMAACCAATLVIVVGTGAGFAQAILRRSMYPDRPILGLLQKFQSDTGLPMGPAVAATWAALILSGTWRPERSWIDRLGRAAGVFWIVFVLFQWEFGRWTYSLVELLNRRLGG